ncbi:MAG: Acetylxylan esterase precursor [Verrucomicrobiota bacterium]|jgi:acetyl esterase/lipase
MATPMRHAALLLLTAATFAADSTPPARPLWKGDAPEGDGKFSDSSKARITVHLPEKPNGAAMVVCPGGGYAMQVIGPEGHGIARWLNAQGIAGIVLEYRLPAGRPYVPLLDAQQAIRTVRANAKEWKVDPAKVGIIGFSAGGHLAASATVHHATIETGAPGAVTGHSSRPDFSILIYPVISMDEGVHRGSKKNLLGESPSDALSARFSLHRQVSASTPPSFLAHAVDDKTVPVENSRMFHEAQKKAGVPSRLLEPATGGHGFNRYQGPSWDAWQRESLVWLRERGFIP